MVYKRMHQRMGHSSKGTVGRIDGTCREGDQICSYHNSCITSVKSGKLKSSKAAKYQIPLEFGISPYVNPSFSTPCSPTWHYFVYIPTSQAAEATGARFVSWPLSSLLFPLLIHLCRAVSCVTYVLCSWLHDLCY